MDIILEDDRWQDAGLHRLAKRAASATLTHLGLDPTRFEISLLGCDDARIAGLNGEFRSKAQATNVLSWPSEERAVNAPGLHPELPDPVTGGELGDIAIAYETCRREADEAGKPMCEHVTHLIVHGVLHLLGYDHIRDPDATLMQTLEVEILGRLGLDNPY